MPESVYDRCQRTTELFEGRVPCRIGFFEPAFSALLIVLRYDLIALIRQRSVVHVRLGPPSWPGICSVDGSSQCTGTLGTFGLSPVRVRFMLWPSGSGRRFPASDAGPVPAHVLALPALRGAE